MRSNDGNTEPVESVIFVEVRDRSIVLDGRHLLQQSLRAGYHRGGESLTVGLFVHSAHTHIHLNTRKETDQSL